MKEKTIDLNCDLGESFGGYTVGLDEAVMPHISSANIACGWHAGDPLVMDKTVRLAVKNRVSCGAHPGYPDLLGFGRRNLNVNDEELQYYLMYQIGALEAFCQIHGTRLGHVKPHGSLYHAVVESEKTAAAVAEAISKIDRKLIFVTLAGEKGAMMARIAQDFGVKVAFEAFPDRAYVEGGMLAPRSMKGAVITDPEEVIARAVRIATKGCIEDIFGNTIELKAHTLCVHGDNPHAVEMVKNIQKSLQVHGIAVRPVSVQ
jgi:5-oxoprolinase (ATP-hydrolysing) subunit A